MGEGGSLNIKVGDCLKMKEKIEKGFSKVMTTGPRKLRGNKHLFSEFVVSAKLFLDILTGTM